MLSSSKHLQSFFFMYVYNFYVVYNKVMIVIFRWLILDSKDEHRIETPRVSVSFLFLLKSVDGFFKTSIRSFIGP